jgi:TolB-like protein/TPR repeat protein
MFTDMVGYTALGQRNESLSLALLDEQRKLLRPIFSRHSGREVKTIGDAFLVEFPSALDAARCAYGIQMATREYNTTAPSDKRVHLRVGIHLGDVVEKEGDILGDAVNIASRIEPLAEDGGVSLTRQVYDQVHNKLDVPLVSRGELSLKNVSEPVEVYRMVMPWSEEKVVQQAHLGKRRVAILPFVNMSPDPNDEYFADGLTEELISTTSSIAGLTLIARTSVMGYKGTTKKVEEIGKELSVGTVLEGSVRKAGNRLRITAQLIDAQSQGHLWAQSYDRELDDVFEVQSDVAKQVAEALRVRVLFPEMERIEKRPTESATAYTLYLKGRYLWNKREIDDVRKAAKYFEQAVNEDPSFAPGYVGWADCCLILRNTYGVDLSANLEKAETMVAKALELDEGLAEAHATKGLLLRGEYNPRKAEEEFRRATELKPSYVFAHMWYHILLLEQLRWNEALEQIEKAAELDPLSPVISWNRGYFYFARRDYGRALELFRRCVELGYTAAHNWVAAVYGKIKMYDEMKQEFATQVELFQGTYPLLRTGADAQIAYYEDDKPTLRRLLPELEAHLPETGWDCCGIAGLYFFLGENDKGFEWLERSYSSREQPLTYIKTDSNLDGVRTDPRYLDLLKRLGLE